MRETEAVAHLTATGKTYLELKASLDAQLDSLGAPDGQAWVLADVRVTPYVVSGEGTVVLWEADGTARLRSVL